jgi:ankyrin repeat and SAM domain-containing protein 1
MTLNNQSSITTPRLSTFTGGQRREEPRATSITSGSLNNNNNNGNGSANVERVNLMSPFDEQEEWAKINEIMESFGSGIARESVFVNDIENEFKHRLGLRIAEAAAENGSSLASPIVEEEVSPLKKWLIDIKMEHLEEHLLDNGYDNPDFINGLVTNENDLEVCGIPVRDRSRMLNEILKLPKPPTLMDSRQHNRLNNNQHPVPTVDQWLASIQLEDYIDVFK